MNLRRKVSASIGALVLVGIPAFLYASGAGASNPKSEDDCCATNAACCDPTQACCENVDPACAAICEKACEIACEQSGGDTEKCQQICVETCEKLCEAAGGCDGAGESKQD